MKKSQLSTIFSICSTLLFVAGIIMFAAGDQNMVGFLFTSTGFLFMTLGISYRRKEDNAEKATDVEKEEKEKEGISEENQK